MKNNTIQRAVVPEESVNSAKENSREKETWKPELVTQKTKLITRKRRLTGKRDNDPEKGIRPIKGATKYGLTKNVDENSVVTPEHKEPPKPTREPKIV